MCILVLISVRAPSVHHRKLKMFSLTCLIYFLSFGLQRICCKNGFFFDYCFSENDADFSYSYSDYLTIFQSSSFDWYSGEEGIVFDETGNDPFHLCPSVHLCNSTGSNPVCSCQPSCIVFKTCCYDAPNLKHQSIPGWESASLLDPWREEYFICVETSSPLRGHHMIGICPLNWEDDVIRRKCEDVSPFLKEEEILDLSDPLILTPVVGAGNVSFRNSFCAICHVVNIMTLQPWKMEINCPASAIERFKANSSNGLSNLGSKCKVLLKPPKGVTNLAVLPCLPHEATSSQCKADMSPTIELEKECETYLAPICGSDGVVYKNPQCLLCTYADNTYPLGYKGFYCPKLNQSLSENNPLLGQGRLENIVPLSIIFDFSSQSGVRFETEGFVYKERTLPCNNGQVFDPFQGSCITFACTEGYKFSNGKCNPTFTENSCNRSNSTADGVMKISFSSSSQSTLEIVNQHAQICVTDLLAMPFNSIYSRENSSPSLSINRDSISLSQGPQNTVDLEFMINFNSTNVLILLENLIAFQFIYQSTAIPPREVHGRESIAMKQVCDAISRIRFEYRCEEITEWECPMRLTRESKWSVNATNETNSVYFPQSQHSIVLTDTNINVDITFSESRVTNFSSSAIYCKSLECPTVTLNASLFDVVSQNGKTHLQHVSLRNFTVPEHSFEFLKEGLVKICSSFFLQNGTYSDQQRESFFLYSQFQTYISTVGLCLSVVCLWVTLATYLTFPSLRKAVSNKLVMTFCFMLSLAQTLLLVLALPTSLPIVCTLVAMTSHYSWLVTFLSTTMLGFDLNQAFAWAPVTHQQGGGMARFIKYLSICFGLPFCIVLPFAVIHFVLDKDAPFNYGSDRVCWISDPKWNFYVLGIPLGLCMTFNLVFFVHTVYAINSTRKQMAKMNDIGERNSMQDFLVFLKISLQLGITWSVSFIANITGSTVAWYSFIILNSLQGVFVLIVLMLSSRVRKLWSQKLGFTSETPSGKRCTVSTISTPLGGSSQVDTKV